MRLWKQVAFSIGAGLLALLLSSWLIASSPIASSDRQSSDRQPSAGTFALALRMVELAVVGGQAADTGMQQRGLLQHVGRSMLLFLIAVAAALVVGTAVGLAQAIRGERRRGGALLAALGGMPTTMVAACFAVVFAYSLRIFPVSGFESIPPLVGEPLRRTADILVHLTLPSLVLMLGDGNLRDFAGFASAAASRDVALGFPDMASQMGIPRRTVVSKYLIKSSLIGLLASLRSRLPLLLGGTLVAETVFSINGLGFLFVVAIETNDAMLLGRITFWFVIVTVLLGMMMDVLWRQIVPAGVWKNVHAIQ